MAAYTDRSDKTKLNAKLLLRRYVNFVEMESNETTVYLIKTHAHTRQIHTIQSLHISGKMR